MTDQNSQLSHDTIAAAIELAAVTQLKSLLGLPEAFSGSLVSGATMANFAGLAIGRQWLGQQHGVDIAQRPGGAGAHPGAGGQSARQQRKGAQHARHRPRRADDRRQPAGV